MRKINKMEKKRSGVNHDYYKNILLDKKERGTATESELNWIKQNFREPVYQFPVSQMLDKDK